jgi:hypothetical protein
MTNNTKINRTCFLLGAGRSGTTLLYKLLCLHPEIAYISNYEDRFTWLPRGLACKYTNDRIEAKINTWFNKGNAYFVKRPWAKKIFPAPNEGEALYAACGLPSDSDPQSKPSKNTIKTLRGCFSAIQSRCNAPVFLSKRTANNRRVPMLDYMFPEALFINLIRDGREVAYSLSSVEWWDDHKVWWDGRTPRQMELAGENRLTVCARNWTKELDALDADLAQIDSSRKIELRYENLLKEPIETLERLLNYLGLEMTPEYENAIKILELSKQQPKWESRWDKNQFEQVMTEEQQWLTKLGYMP